MKTTILSILLIFASFNVQAIDYALLFNGYNDVTIPYDAGSTSAFDYLNGATVYTMEAWVKPTSATVNTKVILRRANATTGTTNQFSITLYKDAVPSTGEGDDIDGKRRFYFTINGSPNKFYNTTDNCINLNEWNHIAVVSNGTTIKLYANGVDVTLGTNPAPVALSTTLTTANFYVALMGTTTPSGFEGYLDKVRVSKVAIDPATFQTSINSLAYTTDTNTIVLMNLPEGTGSTTVNDPTNGGTGVFEHSTTVEDTALRIDPQWVNLTSTKINTIKNSQFNIYPNPVVNNTLIITPKDNALIKHVRVSDLSGKQIMSVIHNSNEPIEVKTENLEKGIYLFQIEGVDYKETRQIIKN